MRKLGFVHVQTSSILLLAFLAASLSACGKKDEKSEAKIAPSATASATAAPPPAGQEEESKDWGFILDVRFIAEGLRVVDVGMESNHRPGAFGSCYRPAPAISIVKFDNTLKSLFRATVYGEVRDLSPDGKTMLTSQSVVDTFEPREVTRPRCKADEVCDWMCKTTTLTWDGKYFSAGGDVRDSTTGEIAWSTKQKLKDTEYCSITRSGRSLQCTGQEATLEERSGRVVRESAQRAEYMKRLAFDNSDTPDESRMPSPLPKFELEPAHETMAGEHKLRISNSKKLVAYEHSPFGKPEKLIVVADRMSGKTLGKVDASKMQPITGIVWSADDERLVTWSAKEASVFTYGPKGLTHTGDLKRE